MKLEQKEIEFFKNLHRTPVATSLVDYLSRLSNHICDSRNWDTLKIENKEVANSSAKVIKDFIIDRLRIQNPPKEGQKYEWE